MLVLRRKGKDHGGLLWRVSVSLKCLSSLSLTFFIVQYLPLSSDSAILPCYPPKTIHALGQESPNFLCNMADGQCFGLCRSVTSMATTWFQHYSTNAATDNMYELLWPRTIHCCFKSRHHASFGYSLLNPARDFFLLPSIHQSMVIIPLLPPNLVPFFGL